MVCGCGCGQPTTIAKYDGQGYAAGQPRRFVHGHWVRWKRKNGRPDWGDPARKRCLRIVNKVLEDDRFSHRADELLGPAFEAALAAHRNGLLFHQIEAVVRESIHKHFSSEKKYGASVEFLIANGFEPSAGP
jgi:hypothetical protein